MKNMTTGKKVFVIAEGILGFGSLVFLLISIFGNVESLIPMQTGLSCVALAGISNTICLIRTWKEKRA